MLFEGRNQVPYAYSCFGNTRGGGKVWHGGIDVVGLDSDRILMPGYRGKNICGRVVSATRVPEGSSDRTWEWGWYICVQLEARQTPDAVNFLYFCHNDKNLVKAGQRVQTGDVLAVMGSTGNAKYASPPIAHVHFEVRAQRGGRGLDPTAYAGVPNKVGVYGQALSVGGQSFVAVPRVDGLRVRPYPSADDDNANEAFAFLEKGKAYPLVQTRAGWAFVKLEKDAGGWCALKGADGTEYLVVMEGDV